MFMYVHLRKALHANCKINLKTAKIPYRDN